MIIQDILNIIYSFNDDLGYFKLAESLYEVVKRKYNRAIESTTISIHLSYLHDSLDHKMLVALYNHLLTTKWADSGLVQIKIKPLIEQLE